MRKILLLLVLFFPALPLLADNECPAGSIPNPFYNFQDAEGATHQWFGVDITSAHPVNGPSPIPGTPVICYRTYFNDSGVTPQQGKNAFVSITHHFGTGTLQTNQDRALWVSGYNDPADTSAHYAMEVIQAELDVNGSPRTMSGPDTEITTHSVQLGDSHVGDLVSPMLSLNGIRVTVTRNTSDRWGSCNYSTCWAGVRSNVVNNYAGRAQNKYGRMANFVSFFQNFNWGYIQPNDNLAAIGFYAAPATNDLYFPVQYGFESGDMGKDWRRRNIISRSTAPGSGVNEFQGPVIAGQEIRTGKSDNTDLAGSGILPFRYTFQNPAASVPVCVAVDTSTANPVLVTVTRTALTVIGTLGDQVNYICIGRN